MNGRTAVAMWRDEEVSSEIKCPVCSSYDLKFTPSGDLEKGFYTCKECLTNFRYL